MRRNNNIKASQNNNSEIKLISGMHYRVRGVNPPLENEPELNAKPFTSKSHSTDTFSTTPREALQELFSFFNTIHLEDSDKIITTLIPGMHIVEYAKPNNVTRVFYDSAEAKPELENQNQKGALEFFLRKKYPHAKIIAVDIQQILGQEKNYFITRSPYDRFDESEPFANSKQTPQAHQANVTKSKSTKTKKVSKKPDTKLKTWTDEEFDQYKNLYLRLKLVLEHNQGIKVYGDADEPSLYNLVSANILKTFKSITAPINLQKNKLIASLTPEQLELFNHITKLRLAAALEPEDKDFLSTRTLLIMQEEEFEASLSSESQDLYDTLRILEVEAEPALDNYSEMVLDLQEINQHSGIPDDAFINRLAGYANLTHKQVLDRFKSYATWDKKTLAKLPKNTQKQMGKRLAELTNLSVPEFNNQMYDEGTLRIKEAKGMNTVTRNLLKKLREDIQNHNLTDAQNTLATKIIGLARTLNQGNPDAHFGQTSNLPAAENASLPSSTNSSRRPSNIELPDANNMLADNPQTSPALPPPGRLMDEMKFSVINSAHTEDLDEHSLIRLIKMKRNEWDYTEVPYNDVLSQIKSGLNRDRLYKPFQPTSSNSNLDRHAGMTLYLIAIKYCDQPVLLDLFFNAFRAEGQNFGSYIFDSLAHTHDDFNGWTPIAFAAVFNTPEVLQHLLNQGISKTNKTLSDSEIQKRINKKIHGKSILMLMCEANNSSEGRLSHNMEILLKYNPTITQEMIDAADAREFYDLGRVLEKALHGRYLGVSDDDAMSDSEDLRYSQNNNNSQSNINSRQTRSNSNSSSSKFKMFNSGVNNNNNKSNYDSDNINNNYNNSNSNNSNSSNNRSNICNNNNITTRSYYGNKNKNNSDSIMETDAKKKHQLETSKETSNEKRPKRK